MPFSGLPSSSKRNTLDSPPQSPLPSHAAQEAVESLFSNPQIRSDAGEALYTDMWSDEPGDTLPLNDTPSPHLHGQSPRSPIFRLLHWAKISASGLSITPPVQLCDPAPQMPPRQIDRPPLRRFIDRHGCQLQGGRIVILALHDHDGNHASSTTFTSGVTLQERASCTVYSTRAIEANMDLFLGETAPRYLLFGSPLDCTQKRFLHQLALRLIWSLVKSKDAILMVELCHYDSNNGLPTVRAFFYDSEVVQMPATVRLGETKLDSTWTYVSAADRIAASAIIRDQYSAVFLRALLRSTSMIEPLEAAMTPTLEIGGDIKSMDMSEPLEHPPLTVRLILDASPDAYRQGCYAAASQLSRVTFPCLYDGSASRCLLITKFHQSDADIAATRLAWTGNAVMTPHPAPMSRKLQGDYHFTLAPLVTWMPKDLPTAFEAIASTKTGCVGVSIGIFVMTTRCTILLEATTCHSWSKAQASDVEATHGVLSAGYQLRFGLLPGIDGHLKPSAKVRPNASTVTDEQYPFVRKWLMTHPPLVANPICDKTVIDFLLSIKVQGLTVCHARPSELQRVIEQCRKALRSTNQADIDQGLKQMIGQPMVNGVDPATYFDASEGTIGQGQAKRRRRNGRQTLL